MNAKKQPVSPSPEMLPAGDCSGKHVEHDAKQAPMGSKGIGTRATREAIVDTLLTKHHLEVQGRWLVPPSKALEGNGQPEASKAQGSIAVEIAEQIRELLLAVLKLPSAENIVVFGSLANGSARPGDLDLCLVDKECLDWSCALEKHGETISALRNLSSQYYGWLDPFVLMQNSLAVRNDDATGWKTASNRKILRDAIEKEGVPIRVVAARVFGEPGQAPRADIAFAAPENPARGKIKP